MTVTLGIGTAKGAWFAAADSNGDWELTGPFHKGWEVTTFGRTPSGAALLATGSAWYGAAIHRSDDLTTWEQIVDGPTYEPESDRSLERIWTIATVGGTLFAGVAHAGLFRSDDDGASWQAVDAFNDHRTRPGWQPGAGGLAAHRVIADVTDPNRMWLAASAVGVFRTEDGGATWELRNDGVPQVAPDDDFSDIGFCVHCLADDPDRPGMLWRQDHAGVFRTEDGGDTWERIQNGIPGSGFGFPVVRDPATGRLFIVPLEADEFRSPVDGAFAVYVSDDDGDSWSPSSGTESQSFDGVLRDAMAVDGAGGVFAGTTGGRVLFSRDSGDTWGALATTFPRILSITVM